MPCECPVDVLQLCYDGRAAIDHSHNKGPKRCFNTIGLACIQTPTCKMGTEELTEIFRTYNIPIDSSVLRSVLEDEDQGRLLAEWAKSHLTPDTLLTKDELNS